MNTPNTINFEPFGLPLRIFFAFSQNVEELK